jgi:hypothetical protein
MATVRVEPLAVIANDRSLLDSPASLRRGPVQGSCFGLTTKRRPRRARGYRHDADPALIADPRSTISSVRLRTNGF